LNTIIVIGAEGDIDEVFVVVLCALFTKYVLVGNSISVFLLSYLEHVSLSFLVLMCVLSSCYSGERSMSEMNYAVSIFE